MTALTRNEIAAIAARHPEAFAGSGRKRLISWAVGIGIVGYLIFAWWLFSIGSVLTSGNWSIAGSYLADWVSYETRPNIDFKDGGATVSYPRFSAYNPERHPDWIVLDPKPTGEAKQIFSHIAMSMGRSATIDVTPGRVTVTRAGETLDVTIIPRERVDAAGPLPAWAVQKAPGDKIIVDFGFSGRADIEDDEIKVRRRFWGWENFFFDANSPFWGKSFGEVAGLVFSSERIRPDMSNAALAFDNILNNAEWQHGDVWLKLMQTIVMAFAGTVLATMLAFPLAFMAARNITPNRIVNQVAKRFFDFLRSVDMLIWALFFTRAFGPGPLAGISAIFFTDTGTFGKLYSEALENIDDKQREGIRSVGANPALVQRYGVLPQVLPVFLSQSLYFWESNTRSATIIGAVGAGGIGLKLWEAMRTNTDWENVAYMVLLILIVVFIFDNISNALRKRLMSGSA
ncbi:phosphonate ABC transporter, permease protein PhnE [Mesorhizobium sp. L-8-10]|uniref:phosphonate ABC transporter, permease protein PhnE n=1 Tax=unclassified Mesorhizobium TaxID=325217 RepID=UPI0019263C4B|nr:MULTISPECIES: phosphonate ABC transporter, permease protein PhnE [unclassified Mesorhizobium]BCH20448.1 phosphonate ABC transporter, permease protein PhnE [Mesorhizobium sp. L-8-3]BCH28302.1 phosphonate ABC transporter, permease protein PhnE [Mesorhizobium sp. L-8-10]